jgi:hypothetical protein
MMHERMSQHLIGASDWLYRSLLGIYPRQFRQEYGPHMAQLFEDCCRDAITRNGVSGLCGVWLHALGDLAATTLREHLAVARSAKTPDYVEERSANMAAFSRPVRMKTNLKTFTKRAVNALQLATEEARLLNHAYIGTEHLLLGLLREQKGVSGVVLHQFGLTLDQVRGATQALVGTGKQPSPDVQPLSKRAVQAIDRAIEEAEQFNHSFVGTEHLLLGIIETSEGAAVGVLDRLGLPADKVRGAVLRALKQH